VHSSFDDLAELGGHGRALREILSSSDALLRVAFGLDASKRVLALGKWVAARPRQQHPVASAVRKMLVPVFESGAIHRSIPRRWDELVEHAPSYGLLDETLVDPECTAHLANLARRVVREAIDAAVEAMDAVNRRLVLAPCSVTRDDTAAIRGLDASVPLRKTLQRTAALLDEVLPNVGDVIDRANRERSKGYEQVRAGLREQVDESAAQLVPAAKQTRDAALWFWHSYAGEPGLAYAYDARGITEKVEAALDRRAPIEGWRGFTLVEISGGVLPDQLGFTNALVVSWRLAEAVAAVDPDGVQFLPVTLEGHRGAKYGVLHVLRAVEGEIRIERGRVTSWRSTQRQFPPIFHFARWPRPIVRDDLRRALEAAVPFPGNFSPFTLDDHGAGRGDALGG
jgi:hypothetical protein